MKRVFVTAICLTFSGPALPQSQNAAQTGTGSPLGALEALQAEMSNQWGGRPGQVVKGVVGLVGVAAALSAASDAVNFKLRVNGDGSIDSGGSGDTSSASASDGNATSSTTSTN